MLTVTLRLLPWACGFLLAIFLSTVYTAVPAHQVCLIICYKKLLNILALQSNEPINYHHRLRLLPRYSRESRASTLNGGMETERESETERERERKKEGEGERGRERERGGEGEGERASEMS